MHYRYGYSLFVLVPVKDQYSGLAIKDSQRIQKMVDEYLETEGFAAQGRFSSGYCDYYSIGGRWSGELTRKKLDKKRVVEFERLIQIKYKGLIADKTREVKALFKRIFPEFTGEFPYIREGAANKYYDDDAQIVDEALYNAIIEPKLDKIDSEEFGEGGQIITTDMSQPEKKEDIIGKYWLVIVDFHQ